MLLSRRGSRETENVADAESTPVKGLRRIFQEPTGHDLERVAGAKEEATQRRGSL
jgi:hypothetical protein